MSAKTEFLQAWANSLEEGEVGTRYTLSPPTLAPFADMDYWYLTRPMTWTCDGPPPADVVVPAGFCTDFASVPTFFWTFLPPTGRHGLPAIVHDWLYWHQTVTRRAADGMFYAGLVELKVPRWKRWTMYLVVRLFGGSGWREDTELKARGQGRVLKEFPSDAKISWVEWRQKPGVFVD